MASTKEISGLSEKQKVIFDQLEQIFLNHEESVISKTVLSVSKHEAVPENCLDRCIEELVNICPVEGHTKGPIRQGDRTELSTLQKDVLCQLSQIFPNYHKRVMITAVCHPSNQSEPLTQPGLLQQCIDDLLDHRTASEADLHANSYQGNDVKTCTYDDVSITKVEEPEDVTIKALAVVNMIASTEDIPIASTKDNMIVSTEDIIIPPTEEVMNIISSDDEDELPSVAQYVDLKTTLSTLPPVHCTVNIPSLSSMQQTSHCSVNIPGLNDPGLNESNNNQNKKGTLSAPGVRQEMKKGLSAPGVRQEMKKGLSAATAHISLMEKDDDTENPTVPLIVKNNTMQSKHVDSLKHNNGEKKSIVASVSDKQTCNLSSASLTDTSFNVLRAGAFSSSMIESSDSDGSLSATDCVDSQSEDDALPLIKFPKKIPVHNHVFNSNSNSLKKDYPSAKLNNVTASQKDVQLKTTDRVSDVHIAAPGQSLNSSCGISKDLQTNFKFSPPKFIFSSDSSMRPDVPYKRTKQNQGQTEGMDTGHSHTQWNPIESPLHKRTWTPLSPLANQQTVTIESTHKITYNNILKENLIGQRANEKNEDTGDAKPTYSMSAPNLTVQVPFEQPKFEFIDTYRTSTSRAKDMQENRTILPASSTTIISKAPSDLKYWDNSHVPTYFPRKYPILRPPALSSQGAQEPIGIVNQLIKPAATGAMQGSVPKSIPRNPFASHTAPNPETKCNPAAIIIHDEPIKLDVKQPSPANILEPENLVEEKHVIRQEKAQNEFPEDPVVRVKNDVLDLFPDVELDHLDTLCQQHSGPMAVNNICFLLLENKYPKKESKTLAQEKTMIVLEMQAIDYYKDYHSVDIPEEIVVKYQAQAFQKLAQQFSWLSANDMKSVMRKVRYLYAPSYKALQTVWHQAVEVAQKKATKEQSALSFRGLIFTAKIPAEEAGGSEFKIAIKLLRNRRPVIKTSFDTIPELQREIDFVKQKLKDKELEEDHQVAVALNEQEYEDQGQCIECGCCFGEYPFEQMVQCYEGHLFCENCLRQYAKESVFGQGKADLKCMTEVCDSSFPKSQLLKALPAEILEKYEDRVTEENLNLADLGDLVKCPHCDFRAFMDPGDKVFRCQSNVCKKESCRYCQVEWEEHFGKKCSEVEKKDETKLRLEYEEKMTKAKVRVCHRCKAQFMKLDGCNKMTCRCGAKMCYICRHPNIDYSHFCRHPRDPGKECAHCKACNLWTNPEEDENHAVAEMQKEAEEERKKKGYTEAKVIGVPDQPPAKKVKR